MIEAPASTQAAAIHGRPITTGPDGAGKADPTAPRPSRKPRAGREPSDAGTDA